jgi:hypothetical protein
VKTLSGGISIMLLTLIEILGIGVAGFILFAFYRNFYPEDKPLAGSLTASFLAASGALAWHSVKRQIGTAQEQLSEMQREQRPWISAGAAVSDSILYDNFGVRVPLSFVVKNTGKTPAFHCARMKKESSRGRAPI